MTRLLIASLCLSLAACATAEDATPPSSDKPQPQADAQTQAPDSKPDPQPQPPPDPKPDPQTQPDPARVAISSVTMVQDCPDAPRPSPALGSLADEPAPSAERSAPKAARRARGSSLTGRGPSRRSCTQSTMQMSFESLVDAPHAVAIEAVRLVRPDTGATLATLDIREPTAWNTEGKYEAWDESVGAKQTVKASYKLGLPDWSKVEAGIDGKPSMGHMFVIEVDLSIAGKSMTARSPEFTRERPHVIVT